MSGLPPGLVLSTDANEASGAHAEQQQGLVRQESQAMDSAQDPTAQPHQTSALAVAKADTADTIAALNAGFEQLSRSMRELLDVAAKTKLLSFNASIVAAQAGEHGRSFAVVAEQMKALNERAHVSTRQMQETVARIAKAGKSLEKYLLPPA